MRFFFVTLLLAALSSGCDGEGTEQTSPTERVEDLPVLRLGEIAEAESFEIELIDFDQRSQIGMEGFGPSALPEETFIVIRYRLKNLGKKPVENWDFPAIDLVDASGQTYAKHNEASVLEAALSENTTGGSDLNPNVSATLVSVWKIEKQSFDAASWRVMFSFESALANAMAWPLDADSPAPVMFGLE